EAELKRTIIELQALRSGVLDRSDPDAEATALTQQRDGLRDTVETLRRRAEALTLLRDTLIAAQRDLQDVYTTPVRQELVPLLARVIDGADLQLSENLGPEGLLRNGRDDALERLSGGTQEQIAILTRLAFARLLARGGQPCPVILDDALVHADDERRARMFDVLNYVGSGDDALQLIYLSCHERAARELGGHRLKLGRWPEK
ncbi:MAG: DNA-binding protein, partial [Pseudomonadota bacterium]